MELFREGPYYYKDEDKTILAKFASDKTSICKLPDKVIETLNHCGDQPHSLYVTKFITGKDFKKVGELSFTGCKYLESLDFSVSKDVSIDFNAFHSCYSLKNLDLTGVTKIQQWAFERCYYLETVYMPNIVDLSMNSFFNCGKIEKITIGPNLKEFPTSDEFKKPAKIYFLGSKAEFLKIKNTKELLDQDLIDVEFDILSLDDLINKGYTFKDANERIFKATQNIIGL